MKAKLNFKHTTIACYAGYITQAVVNNLAPILFIVFQQKFHLSYDYISMLIAINFITQLIVDVLSVKLCRVFSPRTLTIVAHICSATGLICMGILPMLCPYTFLVLALSIVLYAIGGGLIEVMISPIVEAIPEDENTNRAAAMSLLHSFYCWGQMGVVLISTIFIALTGYELWFILPVVWSLIPAFNAIAFFFVPISLTSDEGHEGISHMKELFKKGFGFILIIMLCAGASELAMSQWSSLFAQRGLLVSKSVGDLLGPCLFAALMGTGRVLYSKLASRLNIINVLCACSGLCIICYVTAALSDNAIFSLIACGICGFSVAVMWPGTCSLSTATIPGGGTGMFGIMALAGDLGCCSGPFVAGMVCNGIISGGGSEGIGMKAGFGVAVIFPVMLIAGALLLRALHKKKS